MKFDQMVELLRSAARSGSMDIVEIHPICQVIHPHMIYAATVRYHCCTSTCAPVISAARLSHVMPADAAKAVASTATYLSVQADYTVP